MSCEQNTIAYEACLERFWELMENYDFQCLISNNFLDSQDLWKEKEFGFNEDPYDEAFDYMWKFDAEGMHHDIEATIKKYAEAKMLENPKIITMQRWLELGGTND